MVGLNFQARRSQGADLEAGLRRRSRHRAPHAQPALGWRRHFVPSSLPDTRAALRRGRLSMSIRLARRVVKPPCCGRRGHWPIREYS